MLGFLRLAAILTVSAFFLAIAPIATAEDALQQVPQLIQSGKLEEARSLLAAYLKAHPAHPDALNLLGAVEALQGDYHGAEASFQRALAADPHFTGALVNLGRLYQENAPHDPEAMKKAAAVYARLLAFDPRNLEGNYQSALARMRLGQYTGSLDRLARLPPESQARAQVLAVRCADYAGLGQRQEAAQVAHKLLANKDFAEADVTTILPVVQKHKNSALAITLLEGLQARQLATFGSLYTLGTLEEAAGRLPEARRTLEAAAQLRPDSAATLLELARVANAENDHKGTLGYLAHARELEPNNPAIHFFWGMVAIEENLAEEAYQSLKKAVALDPQNAYYNFAFGAVAMQREAAAEAIPYLQQYCELKPNDPRGRLALGVAYFNSHDEEQSAKDLTPLARIPSTAATANFFLARIANHQGQYADALDHLQRALQAQPNYADAYAELGLIHLKRQEYPQAEEALSKALKLNPTSYAANLNLLMLYQRTHNPKASEQAKRFDQVKEERAERAKEFLRTIEVRP